MNLVADRHNSTRAATTSTRYHFSKIENVRCDARSITPRAGRSGDLPLYGGLCKRFAVPLDRQTAFLSSMAVDGT